MCGTCPSTILSNNRTWPREERYSTCITLTVHAKWPKSSRSDEGIQNLRLFGTFYRPTKKIDKEEFHTITDTLEYSKKIVKNSFFCSSQNELKFSSWYDILLAKINKKLSVNHWSANALFSISIRVSKLLFLFFICRRVLWRIYLLIRAYPRFDQSTALDASNHLKYQKSICNSWSKWSASSTTLDSSNYRYHMAAESN